MTLEVPEEHKEENLKLSADPYVDLFHIQLRDGTDIFVKTGDPVVWDGNTWESLPLTFSGYEIKSDGQVSRPTLQVANPAGIWSSYIIDGTLEKAYLYRYRVLRRDIDADPPRPVYQMMFWIIWNCTAITKDYATFECRNPMDGNNFYVPARQYMPPEFPVVNIR